MHFSKYPFMRASLGLVADWTYALSDNGELSEVLDRLMRLVKADAAMVIRTSKVDNKAKYIARSDMQKGKIWPTQPKSYMELIVGEFVSTAKTGSIWKLSDVLSSPLNKIPISPEERFDNLVEGMVCPLESTRGHIDHIELHFKHQPLEHDLNLLIMLMDSFAAGWNRRAPASISKKLNQKRNCSLVSIPAGSQPLILGSDNPAQLSRCEYRICSLLAEGMTVNLIAKTLSICPATVRSHLSSVFSKTATSSQIELLHQLNFKPEPSSTVARKRQHTSMPDSLLPD